MKQFITTDEFTQWLEQFINFERYPNKNILNLAPMRFLANACGNPQKEYASLHVAGSKGKGSVSTMLASILTAAGFQTGLYASPHILDFRERISKSGEFYSEGAYSRVYKQVIDVIARLQAADANLDPSWFELVTLAAFLLFKQEKMDWAVFEVGMGGRLDTTNIIQPHAVLITTIEIEHAQYLGNTLAEIAGEKAGIIKTGIPVFCFTQQPDALDVFKRVSADKNAPFFYLPDIADVTIMQSDPDGMQVLIKSPDFFPQSIETQLRLISPVQAENAALAACAVKYLFPDMPNEVISKGLHTAWLPARFEVVQKNPLIVVDGAHTAHSIRASLDMFFSFKPRSAIAVFACADDKNTADIAPLFMREFSKIYVTIPGAFKKSNLEKTSDDFFACNPKGSGISCVADADFSAILKQAFSECVNNNTPLIIIGSFYLAAEAKAVYADLN